MRIAGSGIAGRNVPQVAGCLVPFFIVHYGIFWVVHGVFVFTLPLFAGIGRFGGTDGASGFGASDPTGCSSPASAWRPATSARSS